MVKQLMLICYDGADAEGVDLTMDECMEVYAALVIGEARAEWRQGAKEEAKILRSAQDDKEERPAAGSPLIRPCGATFPQGKAGERGAPAGGISPSSAPSGHLPPLGEGKSGASPAPTGNRENANKAATALKKETHRRLREYREKNGLGSFVRLAEKIGRGIDDITLSRMASGERFGIEDWRLVADALDREDGK